MLACLEINARNELLFLRSVVSVVVVVDSVQKVVIEMSYM